MLVVQVFLADVVSRIPPYSVVGSVITYVSDPWSASIVLELRDASTAQLLARTLDRRNTIGLMDIGEVWHRTEDLLKRWRRSWTSVWPSYPSSVGGTARRRSGLDSVYFRQTLEHWRFALTAVLRSGPGDL